MADGVRVRSLAELLEEKRAAATAATTATTAAVAPAAPVSLAGEEASCQAGGAARHPVESPLPVSEPPKPLAGSAPLPVATNADRPEDKEPAAREAALYHECP